MHVRKVKQGLAGGNDSFELRLKVNQACVFVIQES